MSWSIKMFSVRGIDVKIHLTFVLILIWAAYRWGISLGHGVEGAVFGVVLILLLFLGVTLHELGHSFQALRFGVPVQDITLLPIGGVARIERMPEEPGQELQIALAGPVVNLIIGFGLIVVSQVLRVQGWLEVGELYRALGSVSWQGLLAYLVMANIALALFNLIPAFPMDGGRVLRAVLAMRMDYNRATRWAVRIGQALAWGLGLWGFTSGSFTLILIAIFVYLAAGQEREVVEAKHALGDLRVGDAMSRQVQTLTPTDSLNHAVTLILQTNQADFPVAEGDRLVGFLTEKDLLQGLQSQGGDEAVGRIMQMDVPALSPELPLFDAQQQMAAANVRVMPVTRGGDLIGLLRTEDINEVYRLRAAGSDVDTGDTVQEPWGPQTDPVVPASGHPAVRG